MLNTTYSSCCEQVDGRSGLQAQQAAHGRGLCPGAWQDCAENPQGLAPPRSACSFMNGAAGERLAGIKAVPLYTRWDETGILQLASPGAQADPIFWILQCPLPWEALSSAVAQKQQSKDLLTPLHFPTSQAVQSWGWWSGALAPAALRRDERGKLRFERFLGGKKQAPECMVPSAGRGRRAAARLVTGTVQQGQNSLCSLHLQAPLPSSVAICKPASSDSGLAPDTQQVVVSKQLTPSFLCGRH